MGGFFANTTMRSLYGDYGGYHHSLASNLEGGEGRELKMAHVTNMPCPVKMCQTPPVIQAHSNNGIIVAVEGETVYATCTYCGAQGGKAKKQEGGVKVVAGTEERRYKWFILTEECYKDVKGKVGGTGT
jgi:hypothetical protein